jgi:NADH:ubiquinone oxidoreductase subunit E
MLKKILICTNFRANPNNPSCAARGSKAVMTALAQELLEKNLLILVEESPCLGFCDIGPNLRLMPGGEFFHEVSDVDLSAIIKSTKQFLKQ